MTKADLIARLEKEGGSRELDAEVFAATSADHTTYWSLKRYQTGHEKFLRGCKMDGLAIGPTGCGTIGSVSAPNLTTSLDAAIALCERVLPGWSIELEYAPNAGVAKVELFEPVAIHPNDSEGYAHHPATALCIAILEALRALEDQPASLTGECDG